MTFARFELTDAGRELVEKVVEGKCKLSLTSFDIGSGTLTPEEIPKMTALKNKTASFKYDSVTNLTDGTGAVFSATVSNLDATNDYFWKETAIIAEDPDAGSIILAAQYATDEGEKIPAYNGMYPVTVTEDVAIAVDDASQINITTAWSNYITRTDAERMYWGLAIQGTAPERTNCLWVDTNEGGVAKYYDPTAKDWKPLRAIWG